MSLAIVIPYRAVPAARAQALHWVLERWRKRYPTETLIVSNCDGPWAKTRAILQGVEHALREDPAADVLAIADADCWSDGVGEAVARVMLRERLWAVPHWRVHRLDEAMTELVLAGDAPNPEMATTRPIYRGVPGGGIVIVAREAFELVPPDPRFVGWGSEDVSWGLALETLCGEAWRGSMEPLYHLWHGEDWGSNQRLEHRYRDALDRKPEMRALATEARMAWGKLRAETGDGKRLVATR